MLTQRQTPECQMPSITPLAISVNIELLRQHDRSSALFLGLDEGPLLVQAGQFREWHVNLHVV